MLQNHILITWTIWLLNSNMLQHVAWWHEFSRYHNTWHFQLNKEETFCLVYNDATVCPIQYKYPTYFFLILVYWFHYLSQSTVPICRCTVHSMKFSISYSYTFKIHTIRILWRKFYFEKKEYPEPTLHYSSYCTRSRVSSWSIICSSFVLFFKLSSMDHSLVWGTVF